jgi:hypothetical protein
VRGICTPGSAWGDELKWPCLLGERCSRKRCTSTGSAPATAARLVSTILLDLWFERVVKPRLRGEAYMVRYIDDFVLCFQDRADALRVQKALCQRLRKFGLTLESSKTKLVEFGRFAQRHAGKRGRKRPETIYFLGFTLYCTRNRKGNFRVGLRTEKSRLRRSLMRSQDQMRRMRHLAIREQADCLNQMLRGHYAYYGIAGNIRALQRVHRATRNFSMFLLIGALAAVTESFGFGQTAAPEKGEIKLTGVLLTSDERCSDTHGKGMFCRSSDWALASGYKTYLLFGDIPTLKKFERKRVSVSGLLEEEPVVEYGLHMIRRKLAVRSIENNELSEGVIEELVQQLKVVPWRGPENYCSPMCWDFAFTDPMTEILQAGSGAQGILLDHITDKSIEDQIVMLLGGVGDRKGNLANHRDTHRR